MSICRRSQVSAGLRAAAAGGSRKQSTVAIVLVVRNNSHKPSSCSHHSHHHTMSSNFSQQDEYGFLRPEDFDYKEYEAFMSDYLGVLTRRRQKWDQLVKGEGGYSKLCKEARCIQY